jgi:hypothetical protein
LALNNRRWFALISAALRAPCAGRCNSDDISLATNAKANQPVRRLIADIGERHGPASPMLVRLFKQEAELEVWKQDRSAASRSEDYPICRWSGTRPKIGRRPSGPRRLLHDHARPDESKLVLLSGVQYGLSQRLR